MPPQGEHLLHRHPDLQLRQRHPDAAVDAPSERQVVARPSPVETEAVRVGEVLRIPVRPGEAQQQPLTLTDGDRTDLDVLGCGPGEPAQRGPHPHRFLDGVGQSAGLVAQQLLQDGVRCDLGQQTGRGPGGGVVAPDEQRDDRTVHLALTERVLDLPARGDDTAEPVLPRVRDAVGDELGEHLLQPQRRVGPVGQRLAVKEERLGEQLDLGLELDRSTDELDRMSMDRIAAEAGVSKVTVYARWSSRVELIGAALSHLQLDQAPPQTGHLRTDLVALLRAMREQYDRVGGMSIIGSCLVTEQRSTELIDIVRASTLLPRRRQVRAVLADAAARGELRAGTDLDRAVSVLFGALYADYLAGTDMTDGWEAAIVDLVLVGLQPG